MDKEYNGRLKSIINLEQLAAIKLGPSDGEIMKKTTMTKYWKGDK